MLPVQKVQNLLRTVQNGTWSRRRASLFYAMHARTEAGAYGSYKSSFRPNANSTNASGSVCG